MRFKPDDWVAPGLRMNMLACKCDDPDCTHKTLDELVHRRSLLFFRAVGELLDAHVGWVKVTSALRCPAHNRKVGGATDSAHVHRLAIDIVPENSIQRLFHAAEAQNFYSAIIAYPEKNMMHLDVHSSDRVVRGHISSTGSHLWRAGVRQGSGLDPVFEFNLDETDQAPDYVARAMERELP